MKHKLFRLMSMALLVVLVVSVVPKAVYAAEVLNVTPGTVLNNVSTTITIAGTGFDNTAVVLLNGSALTTTFLNDQTITAVVPSGLPVGSYTIQVSMSGGVATGSATLNVTAPVVVPPTSTPLPFVRPQFAVYSSKLVGNVKSNGEVTLKVNMENVGQSTAYNTQAVFSSADLTPTKTGGVAIIGTVAYDDEVGVNQTFIVSSQVTGYGIIVVDMSVTYYDAQGTAYSDKFTLSIPYSGAVSSGGGAAVPTATPTGVKSSQLVITGYSVDVETLQPGQQFALDMTVQNLGNAKAQRITMIVGGGSSGSSGGGTPQPGGVSGGTGDFANFAPVGASNVQSLGDLPAGETKNVSQNLIVNVSTNPGAYPVRISFSYLNDKNEVVNDEQVITLLVYSLPNVDVSFYRTPDPFFMGQPGMLPIQVVNLSKRLSVLGSIKIVAENGSVENGTSLVGSLDAGGYFTLDSFFTPEQTGTVTLNITIDYLDDFNQPRTLTRSLDVEVMEAFVDPSMDPSMSGGGGGGEYVDGGFPPVVQEETFLQKAWRFILGLFGLDSSSSSSNGAPIEVPADGESIPVQPIPGKGG
jgi:hypothetical protein